MGKQKIVTLDDYTSDADYTMEHPTGESKTVPGEAMTVREIYDRYVRGQEIDENQQRSGVFLDDDDENYDSVDLEKLAQGWTLDAQEYLQELKLDIDIKREKLNNFLKAQLEQKNAPAGDASASPGSVSDDSGDMSAHKKAGKPASPKGTKGGTKRSESDDSSDAWPSGGKPRLL